MRCGLCNLRKPGVEVKLEDLKSHMHHTYGFTRRTVADALCNFYCCQKKPCEYESAAGRLLKQAREAGTVRYIEGRERSCYYEFVKNESPKGRD